MPRRLHARYTLSPLAPRAIEIVAAAVYCYMVLGIVVVAAAVVVAVAVDAVVVAIDAVVVVVVVVVVVGTHKNSSP